VFVSAGEAYAARSSAIFCSCAYPAEKRAKSRAFSRDGGDEMPRRATAEAAATEEAVEAVELRGWGTFTAVVAIIYFCVANVKL
jgi:hypothetical protein